MILMVFFEQATYDLGSPDLKLTGEKRFAHVISVTIFRNVSGFGRQVRYWSSGTPCMRSTNVDTHAVKTPEVGAKCPITRHEPSVCLQIDVYRMLRLQLQPR
jgi:hypothetical protein